MAVCTHRWQKVHWFFKYYVFTEQNYFLSKNIQFLPCKTIMLVYLSVQKSISYLWSDIKCNCIKTTWQHSLSVSKSQGDTTISSNSWWRHYQILGRNRRLRYRCCWRKVCSTCCIKFWNIRKTVNLFICLFITYIHKLLSANLFLWLSQSTDFRYDFLFSLSTY